MKFLLGLILGLLIFPLAGFCYLHFGNPPVAVADHSLPFERQIVHMPLHARVEKEMPRAVPLEPIPANLATGAQIYREQCAACHGLYGHKSDFAAHMYPHAPQLWATHRDGVVGVSDDPPGETYWKVANGIRLTGMPAFEQVLNPTQMWQVSLLLANADKPLPAEVIRVLQQPLEGSTSAAPTPTLPQ
jgi:thiosulfate dehydrogenase